MDTITQLTNKIMAERARQQQQPATHQPIHTAPPPPYTESEDSDSDSDSDSDHDEEPMKLTINASHAVHGSNNLVPTSPSALADATKFSTILMNAVSQLNNAANARLGQTRPLRVDLTINCGVTVVGNRNVIGNVGIRPKAPTLTANGLVPPPAETGAEAGQAPAVAGAKRKAEDDVSCAKQSPFQVVPDADRRPK